MQYIGEHLLPGLIGRIFIWTGFISAVLATLVFLFRIMKKDNPAKLIRKSADGFFLLHAFSLIAVAIILYYLIFMHYFEYSYVWEYSSKSLPLHYIISCFWAGQEGSFLIWAICQAVLGVILLFIAREWKNHVMLVVSLSQAFVTSMMLGIHLGALKIGTSPFNLLRDTMPTIQGTIFQQPDYLNSLTDGNGLNPLLENIWMTIHPPILFLGYALALVPFAYAMAALLRKDYFSWVKVALPWTILSVAVLGGGILLGGAWAYVSLTFGGFWSWDPVENSSLVPWMTLIAGLHFMIIARKQQFAMFSAYLMIGLSYILVLYASFLTRSGVLANTSAHSFGDNGMTAQLLVFLLSFLVFLIVMIVLNVKKFHEKKSENLLSREFWMFIGSIMIVLAAFQVIFTTSIPVINSLFHINIAPPSERIAFYNQWQTPFTLLIAGFIAFSQFLNYANNSPGAFYKKMAIPFGLAIAGVIPFIVSGIVTQFNFVLFLFFLFFALIASLANLIFTTSKPRNIGAIIAHTGFLIFIIGTLLTFSNSRIISTNTSKYDLGSAKTNEENLMMERHDTLMIKEYYIVYTNKTVNGNLTDFQIDFLKRENGKFNKEFTLYPSVNHNQRMGDVYNPDTRHFLTRDVYAYISFVSNDPDYLVLKAIINPYIIILWFGAILMVAGFLYSYVRRIRSKAD
jgi:cytochrome c-type biogenesis protein CcmF